MNSKPQTKTIRELLDLKSASMLTANPEYQRGKVWDDVQERKLIDSVFRNYPLPLIYLDHIHKQYGGYSQDTLEIIDGQQRLNALEKFAKGHFKLFDPIADREKARFPKFIEEQPCPWGGKDFGELTTELQEQFLNAALSIVEIESSLSNEARDLFIRLQSGLPLNAQEKRDAWPGDFTLFVLKTAGKPQILGYPGHEFFSKVMKSKTNDRGEMRQLVAQAYMLYDTRLKQGSLCDIKRDAIDDFYYQNLTFDSKAQNAQRFGKILTVLCDLLGDGKRSKVINYEAMSLILLVDSLLDDYTPSWKDKFANAFDEFRLLVSQAKETKDSPIPSEFYLQWSLPARSSSDRGDTIEKRHNFFARKMTELLAPIPKDGQRIFNSLQRELIYYRDNKRCQVCNGTVAWTDAEFHHVEQHAFGGPTDVANGALVHKECHPLSAVAVAKFAETWHTKTS